MTRSVAASRLASPSISAAFTASAHNWLSASPVHAFSAGFRATLGSDVTTVKLPAKSPKLNAYAERFVLCIKSECLNHVVPLAERHLRAMVTEYVEHYHLERTHQGLANELIVKRGPPR